MRHPKPDRPHQRAQPLAIERAARDLILEALKTRGEARWIAHGHSMSPSIPSGSLVTITRCDPRELRCGEVILCVVSSAVGDSSLGSSSDLHGDEAWVLHRIIEHDRALGVITTRGDLTPRPDTPWSYEQALGVLSAVESSDANSARGFIGSPKRALIELIRWAHRRAPRSPLSRSLGLCLARLYPLYHHLKYHRLKYHRLKRPPRA